MQNKPLVTIITPTTGKQPFLIDNIQSVRNQTYQNIQHLVVVDGLTKGTYEESKLYTDLYKINFPMGSSIADNWIESLIHLPYPTGINRYNGHRIYGAMTFIAEGDYHIWLDDDNIIEPNHVESLVDMCLTRNLDWGFTFRKIISSYGEILCNDDCESLGLWPSILNDNDYFIDVNCYIVKKMVAVGITPIWYRKFREPGQAEIDRVISSTLMNRNNNLRFDCTQDYTVQYRVGNTELSVTADFFKDGNKKMVTKYNGELPWKK